jgi:SAM-dependent methyltransferase
MNESSTCARTDRALLSPICNVCGAYGTLGLCIDDLPACSNVFARTREAARDAAMGRIALAYCGGCGHLFNAAFDEGLLDYSEAYENSLHYSAQFRAYAKELASSLVERYGLYDKSLVEIGCGKGDFLRLLCALGGGRGLGFDSSYEPERGVGESDGITVVRDVFSAKHGPLDADFVCTRHVLEHIAVPAELLSSLREALGPRRVPIYVEVPDATYMLRDVAVWDLVYEHPSYFSEASLRRALEDASFEHVASSTGYEGQFLQMHAVSGARPCARIAPPDELGELVGRFADAFERTRSRWLERLSRSRARGERVAVWGAGTKGVTFVNVMAQAGAVDCLVDLNPHKQGLFSPGTGHPVVSPEELAERRPDLVLVMNPVYEREVARSVHDLGLRSEVLVA